MAPPKKAPARTKRRIVAPAEKRNQVRLTVDSKFNKAHFSQLFAVLKIRNKNALAEHIIMNFKTKAALAQIVAFYNGPWLDIPFRSIDTSFVFPLTRYCRRAGESGREDSRRGERVQNVSRDGGPVCALQPRQEGFGGKAGTVALVELPALCDGRGGDHRGRIGADSATAGGGAKTGRRTVAHPAHMLLGRSGHPIRVHTLPCSAPPAWRRMIPLLEYAFSRRRNHASRRKRFRKIQSHLPGME